MFLEISLIPSKTEIAMFFLLQLLPSPAAQKAGARVAAEQFSFEQRRYCSKCLYNAIAKKNKKVYNKHRKIQTRRSVMPMKRTSVIRRITTALTAVILLLVDDPVDSKSFPYVCRLQLLFKYTAFGSSSIVDMCA